MKKEFFGKDSNGNQIDLITLKNSNGMEVKITNFGGIIVSIIVPDKKGNFDDICLGFDNLQGYLDKHPHFGAITGRVAGRIKNAKFTLNGKEYNLKKNRGEHHIHGGEKAFDKVIWNIEESKNIPGDSVTLTYTSMDGEEGYPGTVKTTLLYSLSDANELKIDYFATTDKTTVFNLTNHAYFNLNGISEKNVYNHIVMIDGDEVTITDYDLIPTGEIRNIIGTPLDFKKPTAVGERIDGDHELLKIGIGYDFNYVINNKSNSLRFAANAYEPESGRFMEVLTTEPAVHFYTGNFLDGTIKGKKGIVYQKRAGLCFETQHYPDSPNHQNFPSVVLEPGKEYRHTTVYKFSVK
jgi:aldose 1-epimerase